MYSKFGYCRFRDRCHRRHYNEVCQNPEACKSTKTCKKRHPKSCKKYNSEKGCRFGSEYAYYHKANKDVNQPCECQSKLNILENIVTEMTNMIVNQEKKIDDMKAVLTEERELKEKVKLLEAVVQKMFVNVIKLDA